MQKQTQSQLAIIDLGSNSARLVIYEQDAQGLLYESENVKRVLRLSSHLVNGKLDDRGVQTTLDCMRHFKEICEGRGVTEVVGVATAAMRQARNGPALRDQIQQETGFDFRILTGPEEAHYGYLAVVNSMNIRDAFTVDIGGGSTEVTWVEERACVHKISFPFGAVTLTQLFFKSDLPSREELGQLELFLRQQFAGAPWLTMRKRPVPLIALGGAARNVGNMHQRKNNYSFPSLHHYILPRAEIVETYQTLAKTPLDKRKKIKGLSKDRADIIVAASAVFQVLMELTGSEEFVISTKGLREGLLFERILQEQNLEYLDDVSLYSAHQWMKRYRVDAPRAEHVSRLAISLFDQLNDQGLLLAGYEERRLLKISGLLQDIGLSINVYDAAKHTFYLITNVLLFGMTHRQRLITALLASYKNDKKLEKQFMQHTDMLPAAELSGIKRLALLGLLARTLDRPLTNQVRSISLEKRGNECMVICQVIEQHLVDQAQVTEILDAMSKSFRQTFRLELVEKGIT
ncbi:Ppx/GppA phosphatase family protein [Tumebacillus permanentifrigoris]|uniref:Exopolyphosphatase/guanosine-5'-triphosphate, 3'-diphosphate pyrophosphatase n=1 Tax=Tumebacillus permanentifrigoris TaxID=378543 RepID=A0A316DEU4_9BACL|nr:Ppx/GppA phosphatase family protein [Tumebacillus permanentifrigoris]PWK14487.1 exopolyphosphatase/guanosine-5'-triphosphate,3'-diphosphate pyrophosphatase [Tumebacillus permanentifrigoris]